MTTLGGGRQHHLLAMPLLCQGPLWLMAITSSALQDTPKPASTVILEPMFSLTRWLVSYTNHLLKVSSVIAAVTANETIERPPGSDRLVLGAGYWKMSTPAFDCAHDCRLLEIGDHRSCSRI